MATKVALNVRAAMMHDENAAGGVHYLARPEDGHACACAETREQRRSTGAGA